MFRDPYHSVMAAFGLGGAVPASSPAVTPASAAPTPTPPALAGSYNPWLNMAAAVGGARPGSGFGQLLGAAAGGLGQARQNRVQEALTFAAAAANARKRPQIRTQVVGDKDTGYSLVNMDTGEVIRRLTEPPATGGVPDFPDTLSPANARSWIAGLRAAKPNAADWTPQERSRFTDAYSAATQDRTRYEPDPGTGMLAPITSTPTVPVSATPWVTAPPAAPVPAAAAPVAPAPTTAPAPAMAPRLTPKDVQKVKAQELAYRTSVGDIARYRELLDEIGSGYVLRGPQVGRIRQMQAALVSTLGKLQDAGVLQEGERRAIEASLVDPTNIREAPRVGYDPIPDALAALEEMEGRIKRQYDAALEVYGTPGIPTETTSSKPASDLTRDDLKREYGVE